ncbi:MAG: sporulation protein YunB [Christensenellaceae bacterium]|nr:sporulation protein YunB [Christensenellaceae bacterium]
MKDLNRREDIKKHSSGGSDACASPYIRKRHPMLRFRFSSMCIAVIAMVMALIIIIDATLRAPLRELAIERINAIASEVLNDAVLTVMQERTALGENTELTKLEKDEHGNSMLFIDAERMNLLASEIVHEAQSLMRNTSELVIGVPLGTASGIAAFTGAGPVIEVRFDPVGSVTSNLSARFSSAGINQTRYCAYICLTAKLRLVMSNSEDIITVSHTAALCETLVIGKIPQAYTNVDSVDDALNLIPTDVE